MHEPFDSVIAAPCVFVWDRPEDPASVATQLRMGNRVATLAQRAIDDEQWTHIRYGWAGDVAGLATGTPRGCSEGWVPSASLRAVSTTGQGSRGVRAQVRALCCHIFDEPSRKRRPSRFRLPYEAWVTLHESTPNPTQVNHPSDAHAGAGHGWQRVLLPDGTPGYAQQGDLAPDGLPLLNHVEAMLEARRMLGRPYVWAGATSEGYDCSGLVQMFARRMGVGLPHSSRRMAREAFDGIIDIGEPRALTGNPDRDAHHAHTRWASQLQPGDLLFFAMSSPLGSHPGVEHVDHTGLYNGQGGMIHTSSADPPECREEPLWDVSGGASGGGSGGNSGGWASRMVAVRRVQQKH